MDKLECGKCGRTFKHGKRLETHEAKCTGGAGDGSVEENPDLPAMTPKRPKSNGALGKATASMLTALRARRDQLVAEIPEIRDLDQAIAALEKLGNSGGGG